MKGLLVYDKKMRLWSVETLSIDVLSPIKTYVKKIFPIHPDMALMPVSSPFEGEEILFEIITLYRNSNFDWNEIIPSSEISNAVESKQFAKILEVIDNKKSLNLDNNSKNPNITWDDISKRYYKELKTIIPHENHTVFDWLNDNFEVPKIRNK